MKPNAEFYICLVLYTLIAIFGYGIFNGWFR